MRALFLSLFFGTLCSCEKDADEFDAEFISFPIGRSFFNESTVTTFINDSVRSPKIVNDSCGGYWLQFDKSLLTAGDFIQIRFTRKNENLKLYSDEFGLRPEWIESSTFIDSHNEKLATKAREITQNLTSIEEKADALRQFVTNHIELKIYKNSFLELASTTYELEYGTCMNFSRLYIAMCRSVNIPARSVWGVVYSFDDDGVYDSHHQWAEIKDEEGFWHPCDFGYTRYFDLNDIRYLDLIYGAEENIVCKNNRSYNIKMPHVQFIEGYPVTYTGRLGFELISDHRPDSMIVEYSFTY